MLDIGTVLFGACTNPTSNNNSESSSSKTSSSSVWESNEEITENESKLWYGPSNAGIEVVY
jgi:hypothetical protein